MTKKLMKKCSNTHLSCPHSHPCMWCVFVYPPRYEDGKFAPYKQEDSIEPPTVNNEVV